MTTKLMVVAALLAGSTAFACPDLSGTYTCTQDGQSVESAVTQAEANGVTVYTVSENGQSSVVSADGKTYTSVDQQGDNTFTQTTTAVCAGDVLNLDLTLVVTDKAATELANIKGTAAVSLDANKDLQTVVSDDQGNTQTSVCTRK